MFVKGMGVISKAVLFFLLALPCPFFVVMEAEASGTSGWVNTTGYFVDWHISYPSSGSRVTGSLSTSGTSTGSVSNSGSITNYSGYFYTGSTLASYIDTTYGLTFDSFSAFYTNSRYNGSTSVSFYSGTLYRCTGTNRDGVVVDCVCSGTSLNSYVYEFATAQVGSSSSSSSTAVNKDSGTFTGTIDLSDYAVSNIFCAFTIADPTAYMVFGQEYSLTFVVYFPDGMSFSDLVVVPTVISDYGSEFNGTAVITSDGYVTCSGTFIPQQYKTLYNFGLSFYMPSDVSFSGLSSAQTRAMYSIVPTSSNVISDAVTNFEGSGALNQSKGELDGVIGDYDKVEGSLFGSGQAAFDKFDPSSLLTFSTGIYAAIASISQLMASIILAMGEFSVLYTVGMVLVFFGALVGLWRFFR